MSAPPSDPPFLLSLRGISVRFASLQALDSVDIDLAAGEIRAILGENGAGKSTLMNVVYGLVPASGEIRWRGRPVSIRDPIEAKQLGIGMVHQEFALIDALTVTENLALADGARSVLIDYGAVRSQALQRAAELGLEIGDLETRVGELPVGMRQRIEILRAVMKEVRLLILDEPTAVLTPGEIEQLFAVLRTLRSRGVAILLITHKLREVTALADSVTVLRRGRVVAQQAIATSTEDDLAELMVGRAVADNPPPVPPDERARSTLRARGIALRDRRGVLRLADLDLEVRGGEVLGIAGVDGNGQQELFEVLSGLQHPSVGTVEIDDRVAAAHAPPTIGAAGVSLIPPERRRDGAILEMTVWENAILDEQLLRRHSAGIRLDRSAARNFAAQIIRRYQIACDGPDALAASLSGGNLQKLIVGRALARRPQLVLAFNPTRGLDVTATAEVYTALREVLAWGGSVLLLSTDLDEIMALSNRVAVLFRGHLSAPLAPPFDRSGLGRMMAGSPPQPAVEQR